MKNAIFLDIDGTLLPFGAHDVPESAAEAVRLARKKGNLVFINTGRCRLEVLPKFLELGFDGIICSNAMYIEEKGEILKKESLDAALVRRIGDFLEEKGIGYFFEGHDAVCASPSFFLQLKKCVDETVAKTMTEQFPSIKESSLVYDGIAKINFFQRDNAVSKAREFFADELQINEWSLIGDRANMGEMTLPCADKANGVDFMLLRHKIVRENSFAFGDTEGDAGMVKRCGTGVAMGNASEALKAVADFVTDSVEADGIYNAFKKFDLI